MFKCNNTPPRSEAQHACRCGEGAKTTEGVMRASFIDIPDKQRLTCPRYDSCTPCSEKCTCKGCKNSFGKKQVSGQSTARKRVPKCTSSPSPLKRQQGEEFMSERNLKVSVGSWTTTEHCILDAVKLFLYSTCLLPSEDNITHLYNYVVCSRFARELNLTANEKTLKLVNGKLTFEEERYHVYCNAGSQSKSLILFLVFKNLHPCSKCVLESNSCFLLPLSSFLDIAELAHLSCENVASTCCSNTSTDVR